MVLLPINHCPHLLVFTESERTQIQPALERSATVAQDQVAAAVFCGHLRELEKLPMEAGSACVAGDAGQIRESYQAAELFLEAVAGRAAAYSKSKDVDKLAVSGQVAWLRRQVQAIKLRMGTAAEEPISSAARGAFEARLLGWCVQRAAIDHQEPLHQDDIETLKQIYEELADGPEKEQVLVLIREYEFTRKLVDHCLEKISEGGLILPRNAYERPKEAAAWQAIHAKAQQLSSQLLDALDTYPGFLKLLTEDTAAADLFYTQVIRFGLPLEVFVKHPSVAQFLGNSGSLERSLTMAGPGKGIVISENDLLPKIRMNGMFMNVHDLPGYDMDEMRMMNTGSWTDLGMYQASMTLPRVYAKQNRPGYVHTPEKGLVSFNPRTWSTYDQQTGSWQPVNLHVDNWWEQLPVYRSEKGESGYFFNYAVSHTQERLQLGGTHAYSEIGVPVSDEQGQVTVNYYPFGSFGHFFEGNSKAMKNIRGELFYIDQDNTGTERRRIKHSRAISAEDAAKAFDQIKWERIVCLFQSGLVQTTDGAVVKLKTLVHAGEIDLSQAGLKMMGDGQITLLQSGELGDGPVPLEDFLARGFVRLSDEIAHIGFIQQAKGTILLKPVFNLAYNNCSGFVKRVAAAVGIDLALKVRFGSTSSAILKLLIKIFAPLRFLMDLVCWILGLRDSANDPLRHNQEHFKKTVELENPYTLAQLAKLSAAITEMRKLLIEQLKEFPLNEPLAVKA